MNESLIPQVADFDDPLGVLRACHQRMLAQCETLEKLVPHIAEHGVDAEARSAIAAVVKYFTSSAVHHHQDEEQDLFPVLNRQSLKLADIVHRLKQQHREIDALWKTLAADLKKGAALKDDDAFAGHASAFCEAYRDHIRLEEKELLMLAQHILSSRQLQELGDAMARRRGLHRR
jgi:hemerythrin-like domain-containing protein